MSDSKEMLAQRIRQQLVNCVGFEGDALSEDRTAAYNYYFQRRRGDEIAGRSEIVTGDVSSMVEGNLANMVEPLVSKRIAEFCAYDEKDAEQVHLESECVSEMLFKRQNGFIEVQTAVKNALLIRNGVVKVFVDRRTFKKTVRRTNVEPIVVDQLVEEIGKTGRVDIHSYDAENKKLSATVYKDTKEFTVEAVAPENFLVPKFWHRQDLKGIPFCAERHVESRSTLIERGFDRAIVDALPRYNNVNQAGADARWPKTLGNATNPTPIDKSQESVEWYECYCKIENSDGSAELRCISVTGGADTKVLDDEDADIICYATGVVIINPHTFIGISLYDKLKDVQDSSTAMTRALMDNLNTTNKNRTAHFDGIVEESDVSDGRTNGSIRVKPGVVGDVRAAVTAFQIPDTSANILANLEHMRRVRAEKGGASLDMATGQMQLNDRLGSQGLDRAYSVMEKLGEFMTRNIAHTLIRQMYLIAHEVLRTQWQEPIQFKSGKNWIEVDPSKWRVRQSVILNMGASTGERMRIAMTLEKLMDRQILLAQAGMEDILIDAPAFYNAVLEWLRVNDIDVPERFILDPKTDRAKQAFANKAAQSKRDQQMREALMQQSIALEQVRIALEKYKSDSELQFKYYDAVLSAQIEEAKIATPAIVDLLRAKQEALRAMRNGDDTRGTKAGGGDSKEKPAITGAAE
jgi:hypothetical protein